MNVTISDLKAHVASFVAKESTVVGGEIHKAVARFAEFVEGQQATADATALLEAKGFTVSPPPYPAPSGK